MWSVDKDSKCSGNKNYYPEYMTLMHHSDNARERINRNGDSFLKPKQPVIGIPLDDTKIIILVSSMSDVSKYGFDKGNIGRCLAKKFKQHKGYKWYKVNFKHNKNLR